MTDALELLAHHVEQRRADRAARATGGPGPTHEGADLLLRHIMLRGVLLTLLLFPEVLDELHLPQDALDTHGVRHVHFVDRREVLQRGAQNVVLRDAIVRGAEPLPSLPTL
eukprot:7546573-Pyramimonas_sp.AAC.1